MCAMIADLEARTGLSIKRLEIGGIDFLRDTAKIKVYYDTNHKYNPLLIPSEQGENGQPTV